MFPSIQLRHHIRHTSHILRSPHLLKQVGNVHDVQVNDDTEEEEDDCARRDRDRHRHSELIKLGAAGAGKSGKIGVCVTTRFTTICTTSF